MRNKANKINRERSEQTTHKEKHWVRGRLRQIEKKWKWNRRPPPPPTIPTRPLLSYPFSPSRFSFPLPFLPFFPVPFFYLPSRPLPFLPAIALCISSCFSVSIWGGLERALLGLNEGAAWGVGWEGTWGMGGKTHDKANFSSIFDLSNQSYSFWWPPQHHLHKIFLTLFKLLSNKIILEFSQHNALRWAKSPIANRWRFWIADSNRSPFRSFAVSECLKRIANRAFRIAVSNRRDASDSNRAFLNR